MFEYSSTTPYRVFLKPPFEGVTGHPHNTLTSGSESLKGCYGNTFIYHLTHPNGDTLHSINSHLYVIVSDCFNFMNSL